MPFSLILVFNLEPQTNIEQLRLVAEAGFEPASLRYERNKEPLLYSAIFTRLKKEIINKVKSILFFYYYSFCCKSLFILCIYYNIIFLKNQKIFPKSQRFCFFSLRHKSKSLFKDFSLSYVYIIT